MDHVSSLIIRIFVIFFKTLTLHFVLFFMESFFFSSTFSVDFSLRILFLMNDHNQPSQLLPNPEVLFRIPILDPVENENKNQRRKDKENE